MLRIFFLLLCLVSTTAAIQLLPRIASAAGKETDGFTGSRPFRGVVRRDMAEKAAKLSAELDIFEQGARILIKEPDMRFVGEAEAPETRSELSSHLLLEGAARMLFSTRLISSEVEGFPPNLRSVVRLEMLSPADVRATLHAALKRHDLLEMYAHAHSRRKALLEKYDALSEALLPLDPRQEGGREGQHALQSLINEMNALEKFIGVLPLYAELWITPGKAREELVLAERLAPNNPQILTALAELFLQLDRPVAALEYVSRALVAAPDSARAHDVRGAVLLRQRLPSLAVESFGKAIALAPRNGLYYVHRASAYLILEEEEGMCHDFRSACGLGDCGGLHWSTGIGKCAGEKP